MKHGVGFCFVEFTQILTMVGRTLLSFLLLSRSSAFISSLPAVVTITGSLLSEQQDRATQIPLSASANENPTPVKDAPSKMLSNSQSEKLSRAICTFNSTDAESILKELATMRQSGTEQSAIDAFVNELLLGGPDKKLPLWSKFRPLARFSSRARMASLSRALDLTTPPSASADGSDDEDDEASRLRRRRRALISLLRTLSQPDDGEEKSSRPAISTLERRASRGKQSGDMLSRRPDDLETPMYSVLESKNNFEIRAYEPFTVCSVSMSKPRPADAYRTDANISDSQTSGARAFGALAGYLFGKNKQEKSMAMTTPVFNTGVEDDRTMSFVLPSTYWKDGGEVSAPQPMENSGVSVERKELKERAVVMFGGYASKKESNRQRKKLLNQVMKNPDWERINADEPPMLAQYNDPFTPPWKRLNEVSVEVKRISKP